MSFDSPGFDVTTSEDAAYREVWNRYHNADGTSKPGWMKAPNGKPSKLTERIWVMVRTSSFKRWFGDWERFARIGKLRNSDSIDFRWNGEYALNRSDARSWALENLRKEYVNDDTGEKIGVFRDELRKVTSHGTHNEAHLKSVAAIPQIIKNSIFIDERTNTKNKNDYDSFRYYVAGINIDGVPYTVKVVVGVKDGNKYYDHNLTQIEKGSLIDRLSKLPGAIKERPLDAGYDTKLYDLLQVGEVSKVVDENGEPLVVYHGSNHNHTTYHQNESFHVSDIEVAKSYAKRDDKVVQGNFLNIRNPLVIDAGGSSWIAVDTPQELKDSFSDGDAVQDDGGMSVSRYEAASMWWESGAEMLEVETDGDGE